MAAKNKLIVALDVDSGEKALKIADILKKDVKLFKVGLELFSSAGPDIVKKIKNIGCNVFLDLKFHDIPNTVSKALVSVTRLGPFMVNVHSLGGAEMMKKAASALKEEASRLRIEKPKLIAVTVLTSMNENGLKEVGINDNMKEEVLRLADLARLSNLDGIVASPVEAGAIRKKFGSDFLIVTPGVRPESAGADDQKRVSAPKEAIKAGADYIVVGRPVIEANDPASAARKILEEIGE